MKFTILLSLLTLASCLTYGQNKSLRILPEAGVSIPSGDLKSTNVFGDNGFLAGLNIDMIWGKFGVGLYGGINSNGINYTDGLPSNSDLITSRSSQITNDQWKQFLVGLGPVFRSPLSKKFDLELSAKFGFSDFTYPDYKELVQTGDPLKQEYQMYETKNQDVDQKLNAMLLSAVKLSYKPSEKIAISLGANYTHAKDVLHSYSFLDGGFNPEMSDDELEAALLTAPTETDVYKCNFNSIGITLGVGFTFGGKDEPKDDSQEGKSMEPPIPFYPPNGSTITPQEADSLVLEWVKETPNVEGANYNLWLYEVRDSIRKHDSLIYNTKVNRNLKHLLPDRIKLKIDSTYRYQVQAVDDKRLKPCPGDCYSVDATFTVAGQFQHQYYQLISQNSGNYIQLRNDLRVIIPKFMDIGGKVNARIFNEKNEELLFMEELAKGQKDKNYSIDVYGKMDINIRQLPKGYYFLEIRNERKDTYYFRFVKPASDEKSKN